jgi:hypothetical protein
MIRDQIGTVAGNNVYLEGSGETEMESVAIAYFPKIK